MPREALKLMLKASVLLVLLAAVSAHADPFLVVPGHSLGQTHLGMRRDADLKRLPKADGEDASLGGNRYYVWQANSGTDTLFIHTVRNDVLDPPRPGVSIVEIRATSPRFHTHDGASPGETLAQLRKHFPDGHITSELGCFYLVSRQGIAFEFAHHPTATDRCISIAVYSPGRSNLQATDTEVQGILHSGQHS